MTKRFWEDYSANEFAKTDMSSKVAVLPVGAIEQHGPHLPVSVDTKVLRGIVDRVARQLPRESNVLFLPTLPVGKSDEHNLYPGTLSLGASTLICLWTEIGDSVARAGVKKFVLLNSHGGQIAPMDIVCRDLRIRHGMMTFAINWFGVGMPPDVYCDHELKHGIHAGDMETSVMRVLDPDNVDMSQAENFPVLSEQYPADIGLAGPAKPGWQIQDMNAMGACGNAAAATVEKGEKTLEHATTRLVEVLSQIDAAPMEWINPDRG